MKKIKKVLLIGIVTILLGISCITSGIIENLPKANTSNYIQAYKQDANNILENVF